MRYLLSVLILLFSFAASAQVDYFTISRSNAAGGLLGMVEHRAPANPNGKKDPVILWLHGVDANRSGPASAADTLRIAAVTNKGPLRLVRGTGATPYSVGGTPLPLFQKPGTTGADNRYRWNVVAPQNPTSTTTGSTSWWQCTDVGDAMDYIRAHPEKWDTSCIILVGYSLGGHGIKRCGYNSDVLPYLKYIVDIAGGTFDVGATVPNTFAAAGIQMDFYITTSDELVTNESWTDSLVRRMKRAPSCPVMPTYIKLTDITTRTDLSNPEHDFMEIMVARDTTVANDNTENAVNGDQWRDLETIYHRGLRYMGIKRK